MGTYVSYQSMHFDFQICFQFKVSVNVQLLEIAGDVSSTWVLTADVKHLDEFWVPALVLSSTRCCEHLRE